MKKVLAAILLVPFAIFSQVSDETMEKLRTKWQNEITNQLTSSDFKYPSESGLTAFGDSILKVACADTTTIEYVFSKHCEKDPTTLGMNKAILLSCGEYEKLIQIYSDILILKLAKNDQELFQQANDMWMQWRNKEAEFCGKLMQETYSGGGGTIHSLVYTMRLKKMYKERVVVLIDYLKHIL